MLILPAQPPTVIILAAGKSERFRASGGTVHKLDALLGGKTVLDYVLQTVALSGLPWHLVRPPGGTAGMGESIALGVQATATATGWLILPADLPLITSESLLKVARALSEKPLVVPHYQQCAGHPVGFCHTYYASLASLSGDVGARAIVKKARLAAQVLDLPLSDAGIVEDIDVQGDLQRAGQRLKENEALVLPSL